MLNLFIDANIYLNFYKLNSHQLERISLLIELIKNGRVRLFITELLVDEVYRNREKVISKDKKLTKLMIDTYHNYKLDNGYSHYEIAKKREALENVLIPYTEEENRKMIEEAGFSHMETIFRWNNFATYLAVK